MGNRVLAGRYDLREKIGEGGMSVVFRAQDTVLNRYVAVKILRPEYTEDEHFINSFRRESQLAASIVDSNIVNVYDVGREGNIYFIVMELVEGMPLSDIIKMQGPIEPRKAVSIARQIASALSNAHKHHLIHRDVKPHNILITKDEVAKIADFGIAKQVTNDTLVGEKEAVMGSIHYFSPEQARGTRVDERSDIYSLGIVLYEMITGQVPFDGNTAVEVAVKHISEEMVPPSRINPAIPQDIEDIIMKATAKNPDQRYNNAEEMITDLSFVKFSRPSEYSQELEDQNDGAEQSDKIDINKIFDEAEDEKPSKKSFSLKKIDFSKFKKKKADSEEDAEKTEQVEQPGKKGKNVVWFRVGLIVVALALAVAASAAIYNAFFSREKRIKEINMPSVIGLTLEEAEEKYSKHNFTFSVEIEVYSEEYEAGKIISQSPEVDARIKEGAEVTVTVSRGKEESTVPNLIGKSQTSKRPNAQKLIESYGYVLGKVSYKASSDIPEGYVISQNPEKGTAAPVGTKISLVISSGPDTGTTTGGGIEGGSIVDDGKNIKITIPSGSKVSTMGDILAEAGLCESSEAFVNKVKELKLDTKLRSGDYTIAKNTSLEDLVKIIAHVK